MKVNPTRLLAQSAIALGLSVALAGCNRAEEVPVPPEAPAAKETPAEAQTPAAASDPSASATEVPPAEAPAPSPAVASLGAVSISQAELQRFLGALPQAQREALTQDRVVLEQWLRSRLADKALVAQARQQGWHEKPEIRAAAQEAEAQIILRSYLQSVSVPGPEYPSEQELQVAYDANQAQFQVPARYRVSQIFLAAPQGDTKAVAAATKEAQALVKQLREDKADFAALATEHSDDQASAQRGGDNGYLPLAQLVPELRAVVAKLEPGQISDPVALPAGLHILTLTDRREATVRPLAEVRGALRDALRAQRQQEAARAYLAGMLDADTVSVDGKVLSATLDGEKGEGVSVP
ncbi:hypothetical protein B7P02_15665 [Bordetella bronchiseptica]|uniref:peptidylprolyl isomerase n=1 Tax=Bordetella bronchiseptica TaxID=518 RepID=UPI000D7299A4|nr:peptidylprolyl isomerase [Bordetella bronchiseptica]AWP59363.1 hypothetical protein B7P02_15665 [Bordetella bronchiseptica]